MSFSGTVSHTAACKELRWSSPIQKPLHARCFRKFAPVHIRHERNSVLHHGTPLHQTFGIVHVFLHQKTLELLRALRVCVHFFCGRILKKKWTHHGDGG